MLSPEKIRATTGGIAPHPHQPSQNRTVPRKSPPSLCLALNLPPLEKGEVAWRHCKTVILHHLHFVIYRTVSKIAILFAVKTVGIEIDRTSIPLAFRNANIHICLFAFASALSHSLFVGRGACPSRCTVVIDFLSVFNLSIINSGLQSNFHFYILTWFLIIAMMFREVQARQGCLKCVPKVSHGCETKKHTQTLPYEYSYNSSQPHINCKHQTWLINTLPVSQNVANRYHPCLPSKKGRWLDGKAQA